MIATADDGNFIGTCTDIKIVDITEPLALTATISGDATICFGQSTDITVTITGGTAPYTINGIGQIGSGPFTVSVSPTSNTIYDNTNIIVSDAHNCTSLTTGSATITVNTAPGITTQPISQTVTYGASSANFSVVATGSPAPSYQWQVNAGSGFSDISGETSTTLSIANPTVAMSGYLYHVVILNSCSSVTSDDVSLTVNAKTASVTPDASAKTYGDTDPSFTGTLTGFEPADNVTATYSRTPGETVGGSPYTISATLAPAIVLTNYDITYNTADFTINKKAASVTPDPSGKTYGDIDPAFTGTLNGFEAADNVTATYNRTPGESVAGSPYPIGATLSPSGILGNYNITYNTSDFTITAVPLLITADDKTKAYGDANPTLTVTYTGLLNGDLAPATAPSISTTAVTSSPFGNYPITASGASDPNYTITYADGTLSVTAVPLLITADDKTKAYGDANPTLTVTYTGLLKW